MALTKKQLDVIDDLFKNSGDETAVLKKYNIARNIWGKWIADKSFNAAIEEKIKAMQRQSQILITQYVPMAAAKLIQLCGSDKEETSRKACLDILAMQAGSTHSTSSGQAGGSGQSKEVDTGDDDEENMLDDETAAKLLAVLAEKK